MGTIEILTDHTLSRFGEVVFANKYRVRRLWLISPWVATESGKYDPLSLLIEALSGRDYTLNVVTRPPIHRWHSHALEVLHSNLKPLLFYSKQLHAKLYLLDCDGFRYAVFGSPNLTGRANAVNRELAVELRATTLSSSDREAAMIAELITYAESIMSEDSAVFVCS